MHVALKQLIENGWLEEAATSAADIHGLLGRRSSYGRTECARSGAAITR